MKKVDLFIAGVQKGGTTALHQKLSRQPRIHLSEKKELHFFDNEKMDWSKPNYDSLHSHFDFDEDGLFGEATPIYLYWPGAIRRIFEYNDSAKIIVILRHPSLRALSAWKMERTRKSELLSFDWAVSKFGRFRVKLSPRGVHRVYSYVERGFYADQIRILLSIFPRKQVLFLTSDQLWHSEAETLSQIHKFLEIPEDRNSSNSVDKKYVVPVNSEHIAANSSVARQRLDSLFRNDIHETAEITGLDLSQWLEESYSEPMRA